MKRGKSATINSHEFAYFRDSRFDHLGFPYTSRDDQRSKAAKYTGVRILSAFH
jgi:hypothetical protein